MNQVSPAQEHLESAQEAFEEGDFREALRALTHGFRVDPIYRPLYELAIRSLEALGGDEEALLFRDALDDFTAMEPFYELGYHFVDVGYYDLAIPFLERAHELDPQDVSSALELAIAYNSRFRPEDARHLLQKFDEGQDFWLDYEYYWSSLLCNRPEGVLEFIERYRSQFELVDIEEDIEFRVTFSLDKLAEVLTRLYAFPDPRPLIQDWHFIQYGGSILDYFDDRWVEDGMEVAGGRWVTAWGSSEQMAMILLKLRRWLEELNRMPSRVAGLPGRDSEIIARAAALFLDRPYLPISDELLASPDVLIVAAENHELPRGPVLHVQNNQTLFAFSLNWLQSAGPAPDVAGLMSQAYFFPWKKRIRFDPDTREAEEIPEDTRDPEVIARELFEAKPEHDPRFDEIMDFYRERADYLKGEIRGGAMRLPFLPDSPVPGSYFA